MQAKRWCLHAWGGCCNCFFLMMHTPHTQAKRRCLHAWGGSSRFARHARAVAERFFAKRVAYLVLRWRSSQQQVCKKKR
jgi:hypothetical protein